MKFKTYFKENILGSFSRLIYFKPDATNDKDESQKKLHFCIQMLLYKWKLVPFMPTKGKLPLLGFSVRGDSTPWVI
jgi:hypothetical protein